MVLKGLKEGHLGMLIAAPGLGKSRFALSIALECSSTKQLVGLTARPGTPIPTLVISSEDDEEEVAKRMRHNISVLNPRETELANENLVFAHEVMPFVIPPDSSSTAFVEYQRYIDDLIITLKKFKLVIIDTVSEIIGECDEVKHDRLIKNTFRDIAKKSGAAILLVHHINKNEIRGSQNMTMASGAGLSTVMRYVKFQLGLTKHNNGLLVHYLKKNYLAPKDAQSFTLIEDDGGLVMLSGLPVISAQPTSQQSKSSEPVLVQNPEIAARPNKKKRRDRLTSDLSEPKSIELALEATPDNIGDVRRVI